MQKDRAIELYAFLCAHQDLFSISDTILSKMRDIIKKKVHLDNIIILNPHMDDMLNDHIYTLEIEKNKYYIPLWHNELCYDASGADIIVKCIPELEKGITMDNDNNIYCILSCVHTKGTQRKEIICFPLGKKVFDIPASKLKIMPVQIHTLYDSGIAQIDSEDIYNIKKRGHIYIEIYLTGINYFPARTTFFFRLDFGLGFGGGFSSSSDENDGAPVPNSCNSSCSRACSASSSSESSIIQNP